MKLLLLDWYDGCKPEKKFKLIGTLHATSMQWFYDSRSARHYYTSKAAKLKRLLGYLQSEALLKT
jgi:hypothetical protein